MGGAGFELRNVFLELTFALSNTAHFLHLRYYCLLIRNLVFNTPTKTGPLVNCTPPGSEGSTQKLSFVWFPGRHLSREHKQRPREQARTLKTGQGAAVETVPATKVLALMQQASVISCAPKKSSSTWKEPIA